jgi:hypothetical protein
LFSRLLEIQRGGAVDSDEEGEEEEADDDDEVDQERDDEDKEADEEEEEDESEAEEEENEEDTIEEVQIEMTVQKFDEPLVASPLLNLYASIGVMILAKKVDLFSPTMVRIAR